MHDTMAVEDMSIRRLSSHDQLAITRYFENMDPDTQRMRFGGRTSHQFVRTYASRTLHFDGVVYGAFPDGRLRGIAELRCLFDADSPSAEAALSVEPEWQNRGIGNLLLSRIIAVAQNRGITSLYMICLEENTKMQHLAAKHHAAMEFCSSQVEATLRPSRQMKGSVIRKLGMFINAVLRPGGWKAG